MCLTLLHIGAKHMDTFNFSEIDFNTFLNGAIIYLMYVSSLAVVVQTAINTIKPTILESVKTALQDAGHGDKYMFLFYIFRLLITVFGFYALWGGVDAVRQYLDFLPFTPPDAGIAIGTIFLVVTGQEVIHPLIERLYFIKETIIEVTEALDDPDFEPTLPSVVTPKENPQGEPLG